MDLIWLEDLLRLAEEGNFSRAAERRNSSQSAFSRRVRALEEWIGTPLVNRGTHRITLTPAGQAFRTVAEEAWRGLVQGREEALDIGRGKGDVLRFAATHALSLTFFPEWLRTFSPTGEIGQITLVADNMVACERLMLEGGADLLLCHSHPAASTCLDSSGFRSVAIGTDDLLPVSVPRPDGSPLHELPGTAAEPLPFLEFDERSGMGRIIRASNMLTSGRVALRPVFRSHLATVLLAFAREGRGVAWAPRSLAEADLAAGRLVTAGDERWYLPVTIYLYRARGRRNATVEKFWRLLAHDQRAR